jgi:hypothetical protein
MAANLENLKLIKKELVEINKQLNQQIKVYESIEGATEKTRKGQIDQLLEQKRIIEAVQATTDEERKIKQELEAQVEAQIELNKTIKDQYTVRGRILGQLQMERKQTMDFLHTTAAVYNYAEKIAHQYKDIQKNVGLSSKQATALSYSFRDALPNVLSMGGEMEDIAQLYNTFMEQSGRFRFMDERDVQIMIGISEATNMLPSSVAEMAESFDLMGMSTEIMNETLVDVMEASNKAGLNSTKVIKTLQSNIKQMQGYSFVNGVRGMGEMARQAVKMRIDVSDVLSMSEKFYQPEAAIEAAANLQMLGGDIAKAFGDPFETMYLARNKPEELAKRLQDMTENMLQFNSATGEYELPAEGRMQLKAAGDQLGINTEKMVEMARQASKIKDVKMNISGNAFEDDVREGIAGMAKMKDGRWMVDFKGEEIGLGETDKLAEAVAQGMLDTTETKEDKKMDYFKNIAINTQTMSEQISNANKAARATVVQTMDYYSITEGMFGDLVTAANVETQNLAEGVIETLELTTKAIDNIPTLEDLKNYGKIDTKDIYGEDVIKSSGGGGGGNVIISNPDAVKVEDLENNATALHTPPSEIDVNGTFNINLNGDPTLLTQLSGPMITEVKNLIVDEISRYNGNVPDGKTYMDKIQLKGKGGTG